MGTRAGRRKKDAAQAALTNGKALHSFGQGPLLQMRARNLFALAQQVKLDGLGRQVAHRHVGANLLGRRHHRPDQAHGGHGLVRARGGGLPRRVHAALRIGDELRLRGPALAGAIGQLRLDGDALIGLQSGDADGCRFVGHYAVGHDLQGLRGDIVNQQQYGQRE